MCFASHSEAELGLPAFGRIQLKWRDQTARYEGEETLVHRANWSWLSAESVLVPKSRLEFRVDQQATYLAIHDIVRQDGETRLEGAGFSEARDIRGRLTFVPAGCSAEGWSDIRNRSAHVFAVHLAPLLHDVLELAHLPPALYFQNASVQATLQKLRFVVEGHGVADVAYAETLGLILVWELKNALVGASAPTKMQGGLTKLQLRRIDEFVRANLDRALSISDLAAVAGLSQFHFIRAFKESTGLPPYQYVLRERVELARRLLLESNSTVAEVAVAAGFGDALQLTRTFRKFVGTTPAAFRRDHE